MAMPSLNFFLVLDSIAAQAMNDSRELDAKHRIYVSAHLVIDFFAPFDSKI